MRHAILIVCTNTTKQNMIWHFGTNCCMIRFLQYSVLDSFLLFCAVWMICGVARVPLSTSIMFEMQDWRQGQVVLPLRTDIWGSTDCCQRLFRSIMHLLPESAASKTMKTMLVAKTKSAKINRPSAEEEMPCHIFPVLYEYSGNNSLHDWVACDSTKVYQSGTVQQIALSMAQADRPAHSRS